MWCILTVCEMSRVPSLNFAFCALYSKSYLARFDFTEEGGVVWKLIELLEDDDDLLHLRQSLRVLAWFWTWSASIAFSCLWLRYLSLSDETDETIDELGEENGDPFCFTSGLIACVVSFTFRLKNFATGQTYCEEVSACRTKSFISVETVPSALHCDQIFWATHLWRLF